MSAITVQDSDAMHPMSTTRKTTTAPLPKKKMTIGTPLYTVTDTSQVREAIETSVDTCANTGRPVRTVMTPNGPKKAIVMTDDNITRDCGDYLIRADTSLRETCNVWSTPQIKNANSVISPVLNNRALYIAKLFHYYFSHCCVRIIAKPPLFQAQRFWVSWDSESTHSFNDIGFDWNPAENNEIYVLLPWVSLNHVLSTSTLPSYECGSIKITPVTDLVTEEGLPTNLSLTVMSCPVDLDFYVPKTVEPAIIAEEQSGNAISWVYEHCQRKKYSPPEVWDSPDLANPSNWVYTVCAHKYVTQGYGISKAIAKYAAFENMMDQFIQDILSEESAPYCCPLKCFPQPKTQVDGIACPKCQAYNYCHCDCRSYEAIKDSDIIEAQEQIFEYHYDLDSTQATADYGETYDTSDRANKHWQRLLSKTVTSANSQKLTVDFGSAGLTTATLEASRHRFVSNMPTFKLTSTSNPTSTALYRVVAYSGSEADPMQLPGIEWDMKAGELVFNPYWLYQQSAVPAEDLKFTVELQYLAGAHGTDYHLNLWMNTANLRYHHMEDKTLIEAREEGISVDISEIEDSPTTGSSLSGDVSEVTESQNEVLQAEAVGVTQSERDWKLCTTFNVAPETVGIVNIALTTALFGKYNWYTARRYFKWKGTPRIKIQTTSASTTNAQVFYVHRDSEATTVKNLSEIPLIYPNSKASINEGAFEMDLNWRTKTPTLFVNPNASSDNSLGFLQMCILQNTAPLVSGAQNQIQVAIYCDVSSVKYSHPTGKYMAIDWSPPTITKVEREPTPPPLQKIGYQVKSVESDSEGKFPSSFSNIVGVEYADYADIADEIELSNNGSPSIVISTVLDNIHWIKERNGGTVNTVRINGQPRSRVKLYYVSLKTPGTDCYYLLKEDERVLGTETYTPLAIIPYTPDP